HLVGPRGVAASPLGPAPPPPAEPVGQPAALTLLTADGELHPIFVHFGLRLAVNDERDRGREGHRRPAIERRELLAVQHERRRHHAALWTGSALAVPRDAERPRIRKNGDVEVHRRLRRAVEPEKGGNRL